MIKGLGKNSNGITIIVLVITIITIIIILIIASISIMTLKGDNNLVNKSMDARNQTISKDIEEEVMQQWLLVQNDTKFEYPTNGELAQRLQTRLSKLDSSVQVSYNSGIYDVKYKGQKVKVGSDGKVMTGNFAYDVLKTNKDATEPAKKSPYVEYDGNLYRVLYDSTSEYGVELISNSTIGDQVELGKNDPSGNGVTGSGTLGSNDRAIWSYTNAIETLNKAAETRIKANSFIIADVRCVGSRPENKNFKVTNKYYSDVITLIDTSYFNSPTDYSGLWEQGEGIYQKDYKSGVGNWVIENHNYTKDWEKMNLLNIKTIGKDYWLASRYIDVQNNTYFRERFVTSNGANSANDFFGVYSTNAMFFKAMSYGIRPVIHLATTAKIIGGSGTEKDPYTLE